MFNASDLSRNITFLSAPPLLSVSVRLAESRSEPISDNAALSPQEGLPWESVVCLQQWVWIRHPGNSCTTNILHTTLPKTNKKHNTEHANWQDSKTYCTPPVHNLNQRGSVWYSAAAAEKPEWIPSYYKLLFLWMPASQHTLHSV